jgi:hypothetical protein
MELLPQGEALAAEADNRAILLQACGLIEATPRARCRHCLVFGLFGK